MKAGYFFVSVLLLALIFGGCASGPRSGSRAGAFTVASYNVDDFFGNSDAIPSAGDHPKSAEAVNALAAAIHALNADVLILQEVQKGGLLAEFNRTWLGDMGYTYAAVDTASDARGLTLAVLSRYPITKTLSHQRVPLDPALGGANAERETNHFARDLYRVDIASPLGPLTVYDLHLKSTSDTPGDLNSARWRLRETAAVGRMVREETTGERLRNFVVAGDFNDPPKSSTVQMILRAVDPPLHDALDTRAVAVAANTGHSDAEAASRITFYYHNIVAAVDTILLSANLSGRSGVINTPQTAAAGSHRPVVVQISFLRSR